MMKRVTAFVTLSYICCAALAATSSLKGRDTSGIPPVTIKGNAFFVKDKRFYIRGVDYQPGGDSESKDPLADAKSCRRDIDLFQKLGINTIRVYAVDNSASHDECMKLLADAGIYVAISASSNKFSLNREYPAAVHHSYNEVFLQSVFATVDAFAKYDNTLLFFSGNEVISRKETFTSPYIKAVIRDMKQYIIGRGYRSIPVGYSATDVLEDRYHLAAYLNCGSDDVRSDFLAFNDYSFCGDGVFKGSEWESKVSNWTKYSIPLFLSEYGCKEVFPRTFTEVGVLSSSDMTPVYSGGLIYEYSKEEAGYGLVQIDSGSGTAKELNDFGTLQKAFHDAPNPSGDGGYKSSGSASSCPPMIGVFKLNDTLPVLPQGAVKYMSQGAGPGLGSHDASHPNGSQWAGTPSTGFGPASNAGVSEAKGSKPPAKSSATTSTAPNIFLSFVFAACLFLGL